MDADQAGDEAFAAVAHYHARMPDVSRTAGLTHMTRYPADRIHLDGKSVIVEPAHGKPFHFVLGQEQGRKGCMGKGSGQMQF